MSGNRQHNYPKFPPIFRRTWEYPAETIPWFYILHFRICLPAPIRRVLLFRGITWNVLLFRLNRRKSYLFDNNRRILHLLQISLLCEYANIFRRIRYLPRQRLKDSSGGMAVEQSRTPWQKTTPGNSPTESLRQSSSKSSYSKEKYCQIIAIIKGNK